MSSILIKNGTIVTMDNKILQGDILIEGNTIQRVAKNIEAVADKVIDATNKIVMPGFINCHTHVGLSLLRGYSEDLDSIGWHKPEIKEIESKLTREDIALSAELAILEMIKSGTTTFNDLGYCEDEVAQVVEKTGIRGNIAKMISGSKEKAESELKEAEELYNNWNKKAEGRITVSIGLDTAYNCPPETIRKAVELAKKVDTSIHMHYLETKYEISQVKENYNQSVTDYLKSNNLFDVKTILAHGVWADEADLMELQFHNTSIINNPISNCKLGSGIGDMKFLVEGGINIGLGTDSLSASDTLDMFEEIKNSAYSQKVLYKSPNATNSRRTLEFATIKGAKALGMQKEIGIIEEGRKADIIIVDINKPHLLPVHNVYSTLAYSANGADVETTIVDGKILMENRILQTIDEERVLNQVKEVAMRLF